MGLNPIALCASLYLLAGDHKEEWNVKKTKKTEEINNFKRNFFFCVRGPPSTMKVLVSRYSVGGGTQPWKSWFSMDVEVPKLNRSETSLLDL